MFMLQIVCIFSNGFMGVPNIFTHNSHYPMYQRAVNDYLNNGNSADSLTKYVPDFLFVQPEQWEAIYYIQESLSVMYFYLIDGK